MGLPGACPQASGGSDLCLLDLPLPCLASQGSGERAQCSIPRVPDLGTTPAPHVQLLVCEPPTHPPSLLWGILCCPPAAPLECTGRWGR